jgi:addiction module HigA family antidote
MLDELEEIGLPAKMLAEVIEVPPNRPYQLLAGTRSMTADTALRLSQYFGMSPDFWMNSDSHLPSLRIHTPTDRTASSSIRSDAKGGIPGSNPPRRLIRRTSGLSSGLPEMMTEPTAVLYAASF